jgi:thiamine biosynthesis lipoprotein
MVVKLARHAMATRFELVLCGEGEVFLRAVGEETLDEIERLEAQLSFYREDSEISGINARAAHEPVRVEPRLFHLLQRAAQLSAETDGAFDVTVAPLMRCWGFGRGSGALPTYEAIEEARQRVGMKRVLLDKETSTVRFDCEGATFDLGSIGKGYAIERAAQILRDYEISSALLHGGTSSIVAIGSPPDQPVWNVAVRHPLDATQRLAIVPLRDSALSISAVHGKAFEAEGKRYGHVIDPRTGYPVQGALLCAVRCPSPTDGDALSTAFLVLGEEGARRYCEQHLEVGVLIATEFEEGAVRVSGVNWEECQRISVTD